MVRYGLMYRSYTALFRPFSPCSHTKLISMQRSHFIYNNNRRRTDGAAAASKHTLKVYAIKR